jgi:hypothetical protein
MEEAFLYVNASRYADQIADYARQTTRNGQDYSLTSQGDRPFNDPGPSRFAKRKEGAEAEKAAENAAKPLLRAVVFDLAGVSNVDTTSIQNLIDLRCVLPLCFSSAISSLTLFLLFRKQARPLPLRRSRCSIPLRDHSLPLDQARSPRRWFRA